MEAQQEVDYKLQEVADGNFTAYQLFKRHYSYKEKPMTDERWQRLCENGIRGTTQVVGPGEKLIMLLRPTNDALIAFRKFIDRSGQKGVCCTIFRNEGPVKSSTIILTAERVVKRKWGKTRLYTFVNPSKIKSSNPGFCFQKAGWTRCGVTKKGLLIFEKYI